MKTVRVTVDIPEDEHTLLKLACLRLKTTLKNFLLEAAEQRLEELEDQWLADEADKILGGIKSGKEKLISWDEMKKRVGWDDL